MPCNRFSQMCHSFFVKAKCTRNGRFFITAVLNVKPLFVVTKCFQILEQTFWKVKFTSGRQHLHAQSMNACFVKPPAGKSAMDKYMFDDLETQPQPGGVETIFGSLFKTRSL